MKHRNDAGFSLAALIFLATAVSILLSAAYPAYQMQAKRQTEERRGLRNGLSDAPGVALNNLQSLFTPTAERKNKPVALS